MMPPAPRTGVQAIAMTHGAHGLDALAARETFAVASSIAELRRRLA